MGVEAEEPGNKPLWSELCLISEWLRTEMARMCQVPWKKVNLRFLEGFDFSVFNKSTDYV